MINTSIRIQSTTILDNMARDPFSPFLLHKCIRGTRINFCYFLISPQIEHSHIGVGIQTECDTEIIYLDVDDGDFLFGFEYVCAFHLGFASEDIVDEDLVAGVTGY